MAKSNTRVQRDAYGLFVRTGGYLFRPVCGRYTDPHRVTGETKYKERDRVRARHIPCTTTATVGNEVLGDEVWSSHGSYYHGSVQVRSTECWDPRTEDA